MRAKAISRVRLIQLTLPLLFVFANGCATHALWNKAPLDSWNEPATESNLRVFNAERKNDFLIIYDEYRERQDSVRTRAYWLNENRKRVEDRRRPRFVRTNSFGTLSPCPFLEPSALQETSFSERFRVFLGPDGQSFKIYSNDREVSSNDLPVYKDGLAKPLDVLTPFALAADCTVIGGYLFLWIWAGGGLSGIH